MNVRHSVLITIRYNNSFNAVNIGPISISDSVAEIVGGTINLQCSVDITPNPLPDGTSTPEFEWFYGGTFNQSLNSSTTVNGSIYASTYSISPVRESDGGMYTCRLRGNHGTAVRTIVEYCKAKHVHDTKIFNIAHYE